MDTTTATSDTSDNTSDEKNKANFVKLIGFLRRYSRNKNRLVNSIHNELVEKNIVDPTIVLRFGTELPSTTITNEIFNEYLDKINELYDEKKYIDAITEIIFKLVNITIREHSGPLPENATIWNQRFGWLLHNKEREVALAYWEYFPSEKYGINPDKIYIDLAKGENPFARFITEPDPIYVGVSAYLTSNLVTEMQHSINNLHRKYFLVKVTPAKSSRECVFGRVLKEEAIDVMLSICRKFSIAIQKDLFLNLQEIFNGKKEFPESRVTNKLVITKKIFMDFATQSELQKLVREIDRKNPQVFHLGEMYDAGKNGLIFKGITYRSTNDQVVEAISAIVGSYSRLIQDSFFSRLKVELEASASSSSKDDESK